jgi:AraC-like DNA-binding protein
VTRASTYVEKPLGPEWQHVGARWTQQIAGWGGHRQLVLPDGSADVIVHDDGSGWVVGPTMEPALVDLPAGSTLHSLRLRPGAVRAALGVPAVELRDQTVPLQDVVGRRAAHELGLAASGVAAAAESLQRRWTRSPQEPRLKWVIGWLARNGAADVDEIVSATGLSARQLRRLLLEHAGVGPKGLQRVFRLQRFLQLAERPAAARPLAELAASIGYFDQAHLTHEIKRLSGLTPTTLLQQRAAG